MSAQATAERTPIAAENAAHHRRVSASAVTSQTATITAAVRMHSCPSEENRFHGMFCVCFGNDAVPDLQATCGE